MHLLKHTQARGSCYTEEHFYKSVNGMQGSQQKGGSTSKHFSFHCNHIKLNSPKKGGGRRGAE